jgi:hypothetical protein
VGEPNIERELWWDLSSIWTTSWCLGALFLGSTFGKTTCWTIYQFVRLFFALWGHIMLCSSCWYFLNPNHSSSCICFSVYILPWCGFFNFSPVPSIGSWPVARCTNLLLKPCA